MDRFCNVYHHLIVHCSYHFISSDVWTTWKARNKHRSIDKIVTTATSNVHVSDIISTNNNSIVDIKTSGKSATDIDVSTAVNTRHESIAKSCIDYIWYETST